MRKKQALYFPLLTNSLFKFSFLSTGWLYSSRGSPTVCWFRLANVHELVPGFKQNMRKKFSWVIFLLMVLSQACLFWLDQCSSRYGRGGYGSGRSDSGYSAVVKN